MWAFDTPGGTTGRPPGPPYRATLSVAEAVCVRMPLLPVMVSVKVPLGPDDDVFTVSVEVVLAGFGVNVTVDPEGRPPRVRETDPLKPFAGAIVTM